MTKILSFKYGTSRGVNTYGYNIVTLYANGKKVARTCGGGYDMRGTCLGQYIEKNYLEELKALNANYGSLDTYEPRGHYGLIISNPKTGKRENVYQDGFRIYVDGACGEDCMRRLLETIGVQLESVQITPNEWGYILTDNQAQ